ncbi:MAG: pantoate--beta-alanine ligase [Flavobacterium sp.]|nr:pantoate--beta-alanine ligase [Flavobacterium sp.]
MLIFNKHEDLVAHLQAHLNPQATLGFVPTMGALHEGHLSLLRASLLQNSHTVISIFVNPTQFNNPEDLLKYPRTLDHDVELIAGVSPEILIYAPTVEDIYNGNTKAESYEFDGLENVMEGEFRPGHFNGVGTVVKRLFEIVRPQNAYFGEKDFQQLQIVKKLVEKEQLPVTIVPCPIFREANGLAMSSRNERLSAEERNQAALIYKTLLLAKEQFKQHEPHVVIDFVRSQFKAHSLFELEYFTIADEQQLLPCNAKESGKKYRAFIAVFANKIRLIDTISLN